jgi:hypothetical protein
MKTLRNLLAGTALAIAAAAGSAQAAMPSVGSLPVASTETKVEITNVYYGAFCGYGRRWYHYGPHPWQKTCVFVGGYYPTYPTYPTYPVYPVYPGYYPVYPGGGFFFSLRIR